MSRLATRRLAPPGPLADPRARRREQHSWYVYDWANSGWLVLVGSLLLGPVLTGMAERAACGYPSTAERVCAGAVQLGPLRIAAGSVAAFTLSAATIAAALVLPLVGVAVDRMVGKRRVLLGCALVGAAAGLGLALLPPDAWLPAAALAGVTAVALAASLVASDSIMVAIAGPQERDRVSTTGWAAGYAGGLVVLVVSFIMLRLAPGGPGSAESSGSGAVRTAIAFGALWWGAWTLLPFLGIRDRPATASGSGHGYGAPVAQLRHTLRSLLDLPQTLRFLIAFALYNDGIQAILAASSIYATRELGVSPAGMVAALIVAQVVALLGAMLARRAAARFGTKPTILATLGVWACAPLVAAVLPSGRYVPFLGLIIAVGSVMGATQALSRSLFSRLIPADRAAEFFGLYQATDRGTSWLGAFVFAMTYQLSGDYRVAIATLAGFIVAGLPLLGAVDVAAGTARAQAAA